MGGHARSWPGRPRAALAVRVSYVVLPLFAAAAVSAFLTHLPALADVPVVVRWVGVLVAATLVMVGVHHSLAQALPLAALLELSVEFPGPAPSRLAVARDAGNPRKLEETIARAQSGDHRVTLFDAEAAREILALVSALRRHDSRTRGHSERVRAFTDLIAAQLHLGAEDRDRLRWAALLHDVGKVNVPSALLNKSEQLDESEWQVLSRHPMDGAAIAAPLESWLGDWSRTIAQHHERYDGTGYPLGLRGDEICLGARIVAVADAFDVMTAVRSYRKPIGREAALRELRACSGTHFDPRVVRAMLAVSTPRLALVMGPLSWLGATPFLIASQGAVGVAAQATAGAIVAGSVVVAAPAATASPSTSSPAIATSAHSTAPAARNTGGHSPTLAKSPAASRTAAPTASPAPSASSAKPSTPPGQAKASAGPSQTPPGRAKASAGPSQTPPGRAKASASSSQTPPGQAKR